MRKFSIEIRRRLNIYYNHHLSDKFIKEKGCHGYFKRWYPLGYFSRRFDKPAEKWMDGTCFWKLDDEWHRIGKPAWIWSSGRFAYWEDGEKVR